MLKFNKILYFNALNVKLLSKVYHSALLLAGLIVEYHLGWVEVKDTLAYLLDLSDLWDRVGARTESI